MRVVAERRRFLSGDNGKWNLFDVTLLLIGFWPVIVADVFQESAIPNLTILRVIRIPRMIPLFRSQFLWRSSRILRLMMYSIVNSLPLLFWAMLALLLVVYFATVPFSFAACRYLRQIDTDSIAPGQQEIVDRIADYFPSFTLTAINLLASVFGGIDWIEIWHPLAQIGRLWAFAFCLFVGMMTLGPMNVITGIFVDNATQISALNRDMQVQEVLERDKKIAKGLREIFDDFDDDNSGTLSWQEVELNMNNDRMRAHLATLDLDVSDAKGLFRLVDIEEKDNVSIDDFIQGCMRLKGSAKSIDVCTLLYENRKQSRTLQKLTRFCEKHLGQLPTEASSLPLGNGTPNLVEFRRGSVGYGAIFKE